MKKFSIILAIIALFSFANLSAGWINSQDSATTSDLKSVYFVDNNLGWSVGASGAIIKSTNSGRSWATQISNSSEFLWDVYFANSSNGWIVGDYGTILYTSNGGTTWTPQTSGSTSNLWAMSFISTQTGWAVGEYGTILKTTNAGTTWTAQTSTTTATLHSVHFFNDTKGIAVGQGGVMVRTTNGGTNWTLQNPYYTFNQLYSMDFSNDTTGWAVGDNGTILKTTDAGDTWSVVSQSIGGSLTSVHFADSQNGWIAKYAAGVYRTTNGGATWALQTNITLQMYDIFMKDKRNGWLVGEAGNVFILKQINSISPANFSTNLSLLPAFTWTADPGYTSYLLQVSTTLDFSASVSQFPTADTSFTISASLNPNTQYYWRVRAMNTTDTTNWSDIRAFVTEIPVTRVTIGSGIDYDIAQPLDRYYSYSTHEAIYKQAQLGNAKLLTAIGYYKGYGDGLDSLQNVSIYMKHTTSNEMVTGTYSTTGYTLVYQGSYPNNVPEGWLDVSLQTPFQYNGTNNLQILIVKGFQAGADYFDAPSWRFSFSVLNEQRSASSDVAQPTTLDALPFIPDVRFAYQVGLNPVQLLSPANAAINLPVNPTLQWASSLNASSYRVQVSTSNLFTTTLFNSVVTTTSTNMTGLANSTNYYWRVRALNSTDSSDWSSIRVFETIAAPAVFTQSIPLTVGMNMISSNLVPQNLSMSANMQQLSGKMQVIKNMAGQVFAPPFQTSLSTWNIAHAYQIRMNVVDTLDLTGTPINPISTPITLNQAGLYWLPYYRTSNMHPSTALSSILGKYLQIKSINGKVYQPPFSQSLNALEPGKGYIIKITATDGVLVYPAN